MPNVEMPLRNSVSSGFTNASILGRTLIKSDKFFDQFTDHTSENPGITGYNWNN